MLSLLFHCFLKFFVPGALYNAWFRTGRCSIDAWLKWKNEQRVSLTTAAEALSLSLPVLRCSLAVPCHLDLCFGSDHSVCSNDKGNTGKDLSNWPRKLKIFWKILWTHYIFSQFIQTSKFQSTHAHLIMHSRDGASISTQPPVSWVPLNRASLIPKETAESWTRNGFSSFHLSVLLSFLPLFLKIKLGCGLII